MLDAAAGSDAIDEAARLDAELPDVDWSVLPQNLEPVVFSAPSGQLAGLAAGPVSKPRVVLVPGVTGSKEDFLFLMPLLADAGYRVESYDLAGQYDSASAGPELLTPPRHRYDFDLFVNDLVAVLEAGSTPVHVLGYSFAASVAQQALARRPDLFASFTLLSSPPESGQSFRHIKRVGWISDFATARLGAALMIWGVSNNLNRAPAGRVRFVRKRFELTRRSSVVDVIALMMQLPDLRAQLAAASIPLLVAVGEHDLWPLALHARFAEQIGARLAVYRTGHSPCEESPHQLARDLLHLYQA
ncbi:MAG: alpha/beta fold hydrolase [Glaciihabitans sp.]|nr:alpha/beta fold hydrolase [Glaciihabitans sp.]